MNIAERPVTPVLNAWPGSPESSAQTPKPGSLSGHQSTILTAELPFSVESDNDPFSKISCMPTGRAGRDLLLGRGLRNILSSGIEPPNNLSSWTAAKSLSRDVGFDTPRRSGNAIRYLRNENQTFSFPRANEEGCFLDKLVCSTRAITLPVFQKIS